MPNDLENGYVKITNKSMEALAKIRIPGQARQVLDFILRKTYGWNKKTDMISLSQFVKGTGLSKVAVCKSINKLLMMNIITKKGNALSLFTKKGKDIVITYGFQKNYNHWLSLPKKVTLPKKVKDVTQKGNLTLPILDTTKDTITKDTITKDTILPDSIEYRLANYLLKFILNRNPKHKKPNIQSWTKHIDLMLRIDKRQVEDIRAVIKWCQIDSFWQNNILSTKKLREKFDQLFLKMQEFNPKTGSWQTDANLRAAKAFLERDDNG